MRYLLTTIFLSSFSCADSVANEDSYNTVSAPISKVTDKSVQAPVRQVPKRTVITKSVAKKPVANRTALLQGMWAESKDSNVSFTIKGNSIIYFESENEAITYKLLGDKFLIRYTGGLTTTNKLIKVSKDSLVFTSQDGTVNKLYRVK